MNIDNNDDENNTEPTKQAKATDGRISQSASRNQQLWRFYVNDLHQNIIKPEIGNKIRVPYAKVIIN